MKLLEEGRGDGELARPGVDQVQGTAIAPDLLFRAVPGRCILQDQRLQTIWRYRNPLDAIRGFNALHERRLPERGDHLRRLPEEQTLPPLRLGDIGHEPDRGEWKLQPAKESVAKRVHGRREDITLFITLFQGILPSFRPPPGAVIGSFPPSAGTLLPVREMSR